MALLISFVTLSGLELAREQVSILISKLRNPEKFISQCGNSRIFLPLRFYVKSKLVILESQNLPLFTHLEALNIDLHDFMHVSNVYISILTKFKVPKMAKYSNF